MLEINWEINSPHIILCLHMCKLKLQSLNIQNMHRVGSQVILVIKSMLKRTVNPIPENPWTFKGSSLISSSSSRRANSLRKTHMIFLSACCITVKGYDPANYSERKTWPHSLHKGRSCWYRKVHTYSTPLWFCERVIQMWQRCLSLTCG